jgi:hypothetical protein
MDTDEVPAWTIEETQKLTAPWLQKRTRYSEDPAQFADEHRQAGCSVWRRGVGCVVPGFVVPPSQVLVDKEG